MEKKLAQTLHQRGIITTEQRICAENMLHMPVSVHKEVMLLIYFGLLLLCSGLGFIIYDNIDRIGHLAIVTTIAAGCMACYAWCFKKYPGFVIHEQTQPRALDGYILLLGALLLLIFTGYIQYAYNVFGQRWGLATFLPMTVLFFTAYYFDHLGILSLAVTNLAAWAGIAATPSALLHGNNFGETRMIVTGLVLGLTLSLSAYLTRKKAVKPHFALLYQNFATHLLFISLLAGQFHFSYYSLLWLLAVAVVAALTWIDALKRNSYYFLVITMLYAYIAISNIIMQMLIEMNDADFLFIFYFIFSGIALIGALVFYNKKMKANDTGI